MSNGAWTLLALGKDGTIVSESGQLEEIMILLRFKILTITKHTECFSLDSHSCSVSLLSFLICVIGPVKAPIS